MHLAAQDVFQTRRDLARDPSKLRDRRKCILPVQRDRGGDLSDADESRGAVKPPPGLPPKGEGSTDGSARRDAWVALCAPDANLGGGVE